MQKIRLVLITAFFAASLIFSNFSFSDTGKSGESALKLEEYKGKVVYLDFWASWCVPCRKSFPWMESMHNKYKEKGFTVVAVTVDKDRAKSHKFLDDFNTPFPIIYDTEGVLASQYQLPGMPTSFLIDRNGKIRFKHVGFLSKKRTTYESEIRSLLEE